MPIYYEITDAQVNPNAPVTSKVGYQLRDNSLAIPAGQVDPTVAPLAPTVIREIFTQGSGTWTVPDHVYRVRVTLMGAGGGGAGGLGNGVDARDPPGGGGGSGALVIAVLGVEPGQDYDWTVGARGTGGAGGAVPVAGTDGAITTFGFPAGQELWAPGGGGGQTTGQGGIGATVGAENAGPPFLEMLDVMIGMAGAPGGHGISRTLAAGIGGNGASSFLNGGGRGGAAAAGQAAPFAVNFAGGAGGGGGGTSSGFVGFDGGDGNNGYIILEY